MKRWFVAAAAALSVAACSDSGLTLAGRDPSGGPRPYIVWDAADSIFTTQTPADILDTGGSAWEIGTWFTTNDTVLVTGYRFYKGSGETGSHTARIWTSGGSQVAYQTFTSETSSGWQRVTVNPTFQLAPGTYMVSVNTNSKQAKTFAYFSNNGSLYRSHLTATGGGYVAGAGNFPNNSSGSAYFVDLIYRPKLCNTITTSPCP